MQLLAAYVLTDEDREAHPELVERGFTGSWAGSMVKSVVEEGFREVVVRIILENPGILTCTHAGYCLAARQFEGRSVEELSRAAGDLEVMLWHYSRGEGGYVETTGGVERLLQTIGYDETVARIIAGLSGGDFAVAQMERMVRHTGARDPDVYTSGNAKFVRKEAFLGVRPWAYAGKVDENEPEVDEGEVTSILHSHNTFDSPTAGRWVIFGSQVRQ